MWNLTLWHRGLIIWILIWYLGPISTSLLPGASASFDVSDRASVCKGGRNNQRRTSFCFALRLWAPAAESRIHRCVYACGANCLQNLTWPIITATWTRQTHLSAPRWSRALCWQTAAGRAWPPSATPWRSPPQRCRTWRPTWLTERQRESITGQKKSNLNESKAYCTDGIDSMSRPLR